MPTKNEPLDLSAGTLYMIPLEGGEPVPLGPCTMTVTPVEKEPDILGRDPIRINQDSSFEIELEPDAEAWQKFQEMTVNPILQLYREYIRKTAQEIADWCRINHPDWLQILLRTKKKRIKKKYRDRIFRAFMEERHG
jgi:hypothetical protein